MLRKRTLALVFTIAVAACDQTDGPVSPTAPNSPPPAPFQTPPQSVVSEWRGASQVSAAGGLPACVPDFWQTGFADTISWTLLKSDLYSRNQFDLHLFQTASRELCHLDAAVVADRVVARSWDTDGLGWEGENWCHFQLETSAWGCLGKPSEVWIDGIELTGSFVDGTHIQGVMDVRYDHRQGGGSYRTATVRKSFEVVKTSP